MTNDQKPLVKGGQGRTAEEIEDYAWGCLLIGIGVLVIIGLRLLLG